MEVKVIISPSGEVKLDVVNAEGGQCLKATEGIEKSLGIIQSRVEKPEMYQTITTSTCMEVGNGY